MRAEFSEDTLNDLLKRYPKLDKETANKLLLRSRVVEEPVETYIENPWMEYCKKPTEHIWNINSQLHSEMYFNGEEIITLVPDKDGVIYRIYEDN